MVSATEPDWKREQTQHYWDPGRRLLASIRSYQRHANNGGLLAKFMAGIAIVRHRFWSVITGADIPVNCQIGGGLKLPHPNGIVIHPGVEIGPNCLVFQQVTIGSNGKGTPTIGGHVDIGAGAKLLGPIKIGNHAKIGANAVVLCDVPEGGIAVGIPATVKQIIKEIDE